MDTLAKRNPHERDSHISFEEGPHIYTIDGDSNYLSVTSWNHSHFEKFDAEAIIAKMMSSPKWPRSKYFGMSKEEIQEQWKQNGQTASAAGTKLHYDIECFYNEQLPDNTSVEYQYFLKFHRILGANLTPFRTEWMIWAHELKFAGSIDMVYKDEDGFLQIYDWKRCKEIKKTNPWRCATTECIEHLPDSNFWHYSLQLNTYKALLEKNYGVKVSMMYVVCLDPNNKNNSFLRFEVPHLKSEIRDLFKLRSEMLAPKQSVTINT